jgi:UDP-glucose 4-epimerase
MAVTWLITGAQGFIGRHVVERLAGQPLRLLARRPRGDAREVPGDLCDAASLYRACEGIDTVIHCAGYAHAFNDIDAQQARLHREVNLEGTRNLAQAAATAGVRRFVHLSSVKAMGEPGADCVDESWPAPPQSDYGRAKRGAEEVLSAIGARHGMAVVHLRLAMVYGPGGRGNLERMMRLVQQGCFPPLPETGNARSLVYVGDVVEAIMQAAEGRLDEGIYIVASPQTYSGRQLYDAICRAVGARHRTWSVPRGVLRAGARLGDVAGRWRGRPLPFNSEALDKLLGSACYVPARLMDQGWYARTSLDEGLRACVAEAEGTVER